MLKEFFAREWLEPKLVLYAITHIVAGPLALIWIALIGADGKRLPASVGWLALLASGRGHAGGRTQAARSRRRAGTVASYTKSFGGPAGAAAVLRSWLSAPLRTAQCCSP